MDLRAHSSAIKKKAFVRKELAKQLSAGYLAIFHGKIPSTCRDFGFHC